MDLNLLRRMAGLPTTEIKSVSANSTANEFRKLAGLSPLPIKEEPKEEMTPEEKEEMTAEEPKEEMPAEEPKEELPEIVTKLAAKAEGMKGDELVELIKKVYDAGVADGKASAEEEKEEEPVEEAKHSQKSEEHECPECGMVDGHKDDCCEHPEAVKEEQQTAFDLLKQAADTAK